MGAAWSGMGAASLRVSSEGHCGEGGAGRAASLGARCTIAQHSAASAALGVLHRWGLCARQLC